MDGADELIDETRCYRVPASNASRPSTLRLKPPALAGGSCSGFRPAGVLEGCHGLARWAPGPLAGANGGGHDSPRGRRTTQFASGYGVARTVGRESRRSIQALTLGKSFPIFAW